MAVVEEAVEEVVEAVAARHLVGALGALVRVRRPLGLLREPALLVVGVHRQDVALVPRELRAVPRGVQPGEDVVVPRALVARVADDRVALDEVEGERRREQRHPAAGDRVKGLQGWRR